MLATTSRPPVNGIDLDELEGIVSGLEADSACGRADFRIRTEWKGQTRSETTVESFTLGGERIPRNFIIVADEPLELLGANGAPNPQELLMASINACLVVGYVVQAAIRGITLEDCRLEMHGELDLRGMYGLGDRIPPGYRRINYTVWLEGDGTREQYEEIHQAVMAISPNYFTIAHPVQMCGRLA